MNPEEIDAIPTMKLLTGHTSPETAYVVDDYPYGRTLRCKIRYWVETADKGAAKGQQRLARQTTNPKQDGEVWNKPKRGTYSRAVYMYLNPDNDHVEWTGFGEFGLSPAGDARIQLMGLIEQMEPADQRFYSTFKKLSQRRQEDWGRWSKLLTVIADHYRETGEVPDPSETLVRGCGYVPDHQYEIAAAWVLQRVVNVD